MTIKLDPSECAVVETGWETVRTEVEFARHALSGERLHIRGRALARWARTFYAGRNVPCVEVTPLDQAIQSATGLRGEQCEAIARRYGERLQRLQQPFGTVGLLETLLPDGPWRADQGAERAASWLIWRSSIELDDALQPLVERIAADWFADASTPVEREAYGATNLDDADGVLAVWLGITDRPPVEWPDFPLRIPEGLLRKAREHWRSILVESKGGSAPSILDGTRNRQLRDLASGIVRDYFTKHPGHLTDAMLTRMRPLISATAYDRLCPLVPPPLPSEPSADLASMATWYQTEYLPYRRWQTQHGGDEERQHVMRLARECAIRLLTVLPPASDTADPALGWARAKMLTRPQGVIFWVILDGLHSVDADAVCDALGGEPRLEIVRRDCVVAAVPTLTRFCKDPLLKGLIPRAALEPSTPPLFPEAKIVGANQDPVAAMRSAQPGDVIIWKSSEPDATYHSAGDAEAIRRSARAKVQHLAREIASAALSAPDDLEVRVEITSDHGRLLGGGTRRHQPPTGLEVEGRAGWGNRGVSFPACGYVVENELAHLSGMRFGLPEDAVVAMDDGVFLTSDGRTGPAEFAHGGIFPEEVFVPWITVGRDLTVQPLLVRVSGEGQAGKRGLVRLEVKSTASVGITVETLVLLLGPTRLELPVPMYAAPLSRRSAELELQEWPDPRTADTARAELVARTLSGRTCRSECNVSLVSKSMYTRAIGLEELE